MNSLRSQGFLSGSPDFQIASTAEEVDIWKIFSVATSSLIVPSPIRRTCMVVVGSHVPPVLKQAQQSNDTLTVAAQFFLIGSAGETTPPPHPATLAARPILR